MFYAIMLCSCVFSLPCFSIAVKSWFFLSSYPDWRVLTKCTYVFLLCAYTVLDSSKPFACSWIVPGFGPGCTLVIPRGQIWVPMRRRKDPRSVASVLPLLPLALLRFSLGDPAGDSVRLYTFSLAVGTACPACAEQPVSCHTRNSIASYPDLGYLGPFFLPCNKSCCPHSVHSLSMTHP